MVKDGCNQTSDMSDTTPEAIVLLILYFAPVFILVLSGILYILTVIMKKVDNRRLLVRRFEQFPRSLCKSYWNLVGLIVYIAVY